VGDYDKPKVRLPGGGGAPEIASAWRVFIIMSQSPRRPKLDTTPPWVTAGSDHRARAPADQGRQS
jgi:glutaconate CoA-transferase subunit B